MHHLDALPDMNMDLYVFNIVVIKLDVVLLGTVATHLDPWF